MKEDPKILLLEDQEDDAGLIDYALRKGGFSFFMKKVDCHEDFVRSIVEFAPDIILSDHALPQFNSIEALTVCRAASRHLPFILVTGAVSEEFAVSCLKQGADDYILKSNLSRLPASITNAIKFHQQEREREEFEVTLRNQNKELKKINEELDSFVYSISHNIRAPLSSVLGLIHLGKLEFKGNDNFLGYLDLMERSINQLDRTLREILDYSLNARGELHIQEIDLQQLIQDCLDRLMYVSGFDQITKEVRYQSSSAFYSDPYRISVILGNLLSNACKYMNKDKPENKIVIEAEVMTSHATIRVIDTGIGIPPEIRPRIFDMFYRGSEYSDGAGLGLYIVKEATSKLQGSIEVESQLDIGTIFQLDLPNFG
jgi:signal transduction histidine kinase